MDSLVEIVGLAGRFLIASGVSPVAVFGCCIGLAVLLILVPDAARAVAAAVRAARPEPGTEVDEGGKVIPFHAREGGGPAGGGSAGGMG